MTNSEFNLYKIYFSTLLEVKKRGIMGSSSLRKKLAAFGIAALCFGYGATYIPFSMMTKMITRGLFQGMDGVGFSGFEIQPMVAISTALAMYTFLTISGWWKYATHSKILGIRVPRPQWFTFISGVCTAGIIITTILAYTFEGISIVFAMLLMRGGVLVLAPIVDTIVKRRKRKIYWPSWVAALFSLGALVAAFAGKASSAITVIAAIDIALYIFCYFFRFLFMSNRAKSENVEERKRYFAEEQMTANTVLPIAIFIVALFGSQMSPESIPGKFWLGFTTFPTQGYLVHAALIGIFSCGIGIFGNLIYLDKRENTFTVPANRSSSILAGVIATYLLAIFWGQKYPSMHQLIGVVLILFAIFFLSYRNIVAGRRTAKAAKAQKKSTAKGLKPAVEVE